VGVGIAAPSCRSKVGSSSIRLLVRHVGVWFSPSFIRQAGVGLLTPPCCLLRRRRFPTSSSLVVSPLPSFSLVVPFLPPPRHLRCCILPHFVGRLYHNGYSARPLRGLLGGVIGVGLADRRRSRRGSLRWCRAGLVVRIGVRYASVVMPSSSFTMTAFGVRVVVVAGSRWYCSR
jgi:hypothetical protein